MILIYQPAYKFLVMPGLFISLPLCE